MQSETTMSGAALGNLAALIARSWRQARTRHNKKGVYGTRSAKVRKARTANATMRAAGSDVGARCERGRTQHGSCDSWQSGRESDNGMRNAQWISSSSGWSRCSVLEATPD